MRTSVTVALLNYKRPQNLPEVIDSIKSQSVPTAVFLWNNAPRPIRHPGINWAVQSSANVICWPRWWMLSMAQTDYVATLDDDFAFGDPHILREACKILAMRPPGCVVGANGVRMPTKRDPRRLRMGHPQPTTEAEFIKKDAAVDFVIGRHMLMRTADLRARVPLYTLDAKDDDMCVCHAMARGQRLWHLCLALYCGAMKKLDEHGVGLRLDADHKERRKALSEKFWSE